MPLIGAPLRGWANVDPAGRQAAAGHLDRAVDPQAPRRPIISDAVAARDAHPRAGRAGDFGGFDPRRAAAGEIDHPERAGRVEIPDRVADRGADRRRDRPDRRLGRGGQRPGDARHHRRVERRAVRGIVADHHERAAGDAEPIFCRRAACDRHRWSPAATAARTASTEP